MDISQMDKEIVSQMLHQKYSAPVDSPLMEKEVVSGLQAVFHGQIVELKHGKMVEVQFIHLQL